MSISFCASGSALDDGESPVAGSSSSTTAVSPSALDPSTSVLLNALKKENETLRNRLAATERDYVRVTRLNEIYREELIQHRTRVSARLLDHRAGALTLSLFSLFSVRSLGRQSHRTQC